MNEMKRCPFCGAEVEEQFPYFYFHEGMEEWVFSHYCPHEGETLAVSISLWGKTREEVIERWNARAEV